jgi:hypothetical protein
MSRAINRSIGWRARPGIQPRLQSDLWGFHCSSTTQKQPFDETLCAHLF